MYEQGLCQSTSLFSLVSRWLYTNYEIAQWFPFRPSVISSLGGAEINKGATDIVKANTRSADNVDRCLSALSNWKLNNERKYNNPSCKTAGTHFLLGK